MPDNRASRSALLALVLLCCWTGLAYAQGVMADFQKAQKLYKAGQTGQASKLLKRIVKKYPDHQPSHLLLGRIAFRDGKISRAVKHFKRVPPDLISSDMGYEYGIAMFQARNCKKANAGFAKVKPSDKAASLSYFYRGVCYLRGREHQRAVVYLKKAKKLPPNLQESRRDALAEARRRMKAEQQGRAPQGNSYFVVPTPPPPVYPEAPTAGGPPLPQGEAAGQPPPPKKPPPPPQAGFDNSVTPSLTLTQAARSQDYFGHKLNETETTTTEIKLGLKSKYNFASTSTGKQPYAQLPLDLGQKSESSKGADTSYVTYENDPGTVIEQESNAKSTASRAASVALSPELGYPITGALQLAVGYKYEETYPDMAADKKSGAKTPNGRLTLGLDPLTVELSGNQKESFDSYDMIVKTEQTMGGKVTLDLDSVDVTGAAQQTTIAKGPAASLPPNSPPSQAGTQQLEGTLTKSWDSFNMSLATLYWTQTLAPGVTVNKDRPEMSSLKLSVAANLTFDFGGTASLTLAQIKKSEFRQSFESKDAPGSAPAPLQTPAPAPAPEVKPQKLITAEGTDQQVVGSFKLAPLEWAYAQVSLDYQTRAYALSDATYQVEFQKANAEIVTEFKLTLGLSKSF
jgi:tetratricopeptide (TPR) repeat protein